MKIRLIIAGLFLMLGTANLRAQFIVSDPINTATSITNSVNEIVQTSSTVSNVIKNFQEVRKVYEQGKKYYDALKAVNDMVKDARKVQETILMVGEIADIYINSYQLMLQDENFTLEELGAIAFGYGKLLQESSNLLKDLKGIVNASSLSMTDKDRMDIIDGTYVAVQRYRNLVRYYTNKNLSVSYLRAQKKGETERMLALYGNADERYW
ncbi:DUF4141 domain-containing protein [Maribellus comscasis]|uniref:DUF4141 domain-containing protein n=1 Tax=Maribellus comscasis TaxID=2681766 RepID=A0A6I6JWQ9_9BACT|nr:DUF4141 domain-containing protein [Maribellus comscasis]QGY45769.1 DUF4141 domain-containing protein [Maribellus comscasis]